MTAQSAFTESHLYGDRHCLLAFHTSSLLESSQTANGAGAITSFLGDNGSGTERMKSSQSRLSRHGRLSRGLNTGSLHLEPTLLTNAPLSKGLQSHVGSNALTISFPLRWMSSSSSS